MKLNPFFADVIRYTREHPNPRFKSATEKLGKLGEEFGEFCGAVLIEDGRCPHKTLNEPAFGEAADIILCVLDVLEKLHPGYEADELVIELSRALETKMDKWKSINIQNDE